jgi:hypothetical protein
MWKKRANVNIYVFFLSALTSIHPPPPKPGTSFLP